VNPKGVDMSRRCALSQRRLACSFVNPSGLLAGMNSERQ
jgi:hypothetical protein